MGYYVIKRGDKEGRMLRGLGIGSCNNLTPVQFTSYIPHAIRFEEEEAEETIKFITNVIDWELGEQLYIEEIK